MKPMVCRKCKTEANRPQMLRRKVTERGRDLIEEKILEKIYSCECGNFVFEGDIPADQVSKQVRIVS